MTKRSLNKLSTQNRRSFMACSAAALLGVTYKPSSFADKKKNYPLRKNPAKRIISLYMGGGMSQLETFSPRPEAAVEVTGPGKAIKTSVDGIQISHYMPKTAKLIHHGVIFRSLNSNQGAHAEASYFMKTNWRMRGTIQHPHLGSWANKLDGKLNPELPGFINISSFVPKTGAGYMGADYEPLLIRSPEEGLTTAKIRKGETLQELNRKINLAKRLDAKFRKTYAGQEVDSYGKIYEATGKLMTSKDLDAFDISQESKQRKKLYGESRFGMACLLARRLSKSGVRFVEVDMGGWDTHTENFKRVPFLSSELDRGLSALLTDLASTGELDETLIVVKSEFGRTPVINVNEGRDHYPQAFCGFVAGGGIKGGQVYGDIDKEGKKITKDKLDVTDFNSTIAWASGLDVFHEVKSPSGRPFTLAGKGKPVTELFGA